jgi:NADPH:quinone reductase-like Zn-dependent oxidoreductase
VTTLSDMEATMEATYQAVVLTGKGDLDRVQTRALPLQSPRAGELRIRVRAAGAGATDLTMRTGSYLYRPPFPFTVGYEVVGDVDAIGDGVSGFAIGDRVCALTVYGAQAEYLVRDAADFVKVPRGLDDAEVIALILNYVTAYQMIHRCTSLRAGQTALVTGPRGGVGSALVELLALVGVRAIGVSRGQPLEETVRTAAPEGVDVSFDGLGGLGTAACIRATKKGGTVVGYGFMAATRDGKPSTWLGLRGFWSIFVGAFFAGRRGVFYGITQRYRKDRAPFQEDLTKLFALLQKRDVQPKIAARLPLLAGVEAQRLLEKGGVAGKIVLLRDR